MTTESNNQSFADGNGRKLSEESIVISGMSGLYPNSYSVKDLSQILYDKVNPMKKTESWNCNHPERAKYKGYIPDLEYFDAQFFKVHYRLGFNMDPTSRKILEQAYQAIYDAGVNPENLSGKKVGVYIGTSYLETEKYVLFSTVKTGFGIMGCSKTMFANRISYWLNLKGPSLAIEEECCSSSAALACAFSAIKRGDCEAALVGGTFVCLHPQSSVNCGRNINMSKDGKTRSFDNDAAGCCMSEAVNILFIQKAKDALRVYGEVVHAKCEVTSGFDSELGPAYGLYRNPKDSIKFLNTFYKEINISPQDVQYVEAVGSATPEADKSELETFDEVFCKTRSKPLLVGSVMSNIGYSKAATGIAAITKVLLGYQHGKLAANLHFESPREDVPALKEGRIEIVKEHTEFDCTYAAVNNLSVTGVNAHILLHGHYKPKDINRYKTNIPRIVVLSGRKEESVMKIIDDLKSRPIDPEELALLHNIHERRITGHLGQGFIILDTNDKNETVSLSEATCYFDQGKRPLWFVYSGMGSQWPGMGKELMRIPIFAAAIERCHRVLEPKGLNIVDIITSDDKTMFDNILHSFVGITAVQIGLTDVLRELDIQPDNIIGHSLGETACAYADGCFTAEETILCSYSRGLVSIQTSLIRGSMAAVGLGYREVLKLCPPEIEVACHNSPESSTISGPADVLAKFVDQLTSKKIFCKEVPCSNIAYHSRYIADAGPSMFTYLSEIITSPKPRSTRWVSTSVPQDRWDEPSAKYSSAEYHTNNLLNPVLFEETSKLISPDAVLIEIAPHGLLQAILKRSLPSSCRLLPLTRRGHLNSTNFLLEAIGRLSMEGYYPKVKALYPKVEFPVSSSTPMLSHLVDWAHHEKWIVFVYDGDNKKTAARTTNIISTYDDEYSYLRGHVVRGKNLYPYSAVLVSVWDTLLMSLNVKPKSLSVQFSDLFLFSQPVLHEQNQVRISVVIQRGTGQFEVMNDNSLVMRGFINVYSNTENPPTPQITNTNVCAKDVYQLLHARDFHYKDDFRSIHSVNEILTEAEIEWKKNWVTFIDGILQLNILNQKHSSVSKLTAVTSLVIDINKHYEIIRDNAVELINAHVLEEIKSTVCGGVILKNPKFQDLPILKDERIALYKTANIINNDDKFKNAFCLSLKKEIYSGNEEVVKIVNTGDPNSLIWVKTVQDTGVGVHVKVKYAGINTVYANSILGLIANKNKNLNNNIVDFSGITKSGRRVMGIVKCDSITSQVNTDSELLWPVPEHWSLEDAATVPFAYSMALYILLVKTELIADHTILVQGGAGALGQAVISIALAKGCEIFTTVSDSSKKHFLRRLFPHLKEQNILCSRDASFVDTIMSITKGNGCNIIISCANDYLKNFSFRCLAHNGILFDTTLIHTCENYKFGLNHLTRQRAYVPVDFLSVFQPKYLENMKYIKTLMCEGIAHGYVRPLTRITFAPEDASRAFRLQSAHHNRGRILLDLQNLGSHVLPRIVCSPSSWQLILSDNEILTLKLAERLVKQGAKKLVLLISITSKCIHVQSRLWQENGVEIKLIPENIWKESNLLNTIQTCKENGGLESVVLIVSNKSINVNDVAEKITDIVQKSCVLLTRFAIVSIGNGSNAQTPKIIPSHDVQMITKIKLPELDMMQNKELSNNNTALTLNNAMDVLEEALCFQQSAILVQIDKTHKISLLEQLLKVAGLKKEAVLEKSYDIKLGDLIHDHSKLPAIQVYLQNEYDICLTMEYIKTLSIKSIIELGKQCMGYDYEESQGISSYFRDSDTNELTSTADVVYLPTLSNREIRGDEIDANKTHLYIVPGIEGHHSRFREMCERLKIPALVLQPGLDRADESMAELAMRYVKILTQKAEIRNNFYLLGYESGVCVALEMAAILEERGLKKEAVLEKSYDIKLGDLIHDHSKLPAIQVYLQNEYDICLTMEYIKTLSIKSIIELGKQCMGYDYEESQGISSYFRDSDTNELTSTADVVYLPTLSNREIRGDEIDANKTHLYIVPGIEGHHSRFREMCERLKIPALVLQPGLDRADESMAELAMRYVKILTQKAEIRNNFYLLGYESGVCVALEMAAILEERGLTGTVFCLGGSPAEVLLNFKQNLSVYETKEQLQMAVVKHVYTLFTKEDSDVLDHLCRNLEWHGKVDACERSVRGRIPHTMQYVKKFLEAVYTRLLLILKYIPAYFEPKILKSQLISLRPQYTTSMDISLQNYSCQKIISYQLQAPLSFVTQDLMCAAIINCHLDGKILEDFNNTSACETYVVEQRYA